MAYDRPIPRGGLTTGQLAALLGVPEYRIVSLVRAQVITVPPLRHARCRLWPPASVEEVRAELVRRGVIAGGDSTMSTAREAVGGTGATP